VVEELPTNVVETTTSQEPTMTQLATTLVTTAPLASLTLTFEMVEREIVVDFEVSWIPGSSLSANSFA